MVFLLLLLIGVAEFLLLLELVQALEIDFMPFQNILLLAWLFSIFFFYFWGWKLEGCRLPLQLQNRQEPFSDALWEPHISILSRFIWHFNFYCGARVREAKRKTKKNRCNFSTAAMSSSYLWFRIVLWCDGVYSMLVHYKSFIIFMA